MSMRQRQEVQEVLRSSLIPAEVRLEDETVWLSRAAEERAVFALASLGASTGIFSFIDFFSTVLYYLVVLNRINQTLTALGVRIQKRRGADSNWLLTVDVDGEKHILAVLERRRAPYPNEIRSLKRLRDSLARSGVPLLIAPYIPAKTGLALSKNGWSWADGRGSCDIRAPGLRLRQSTTDQPRRASRRKRELPGGAGGLGVVRYLLCATEPGAPIDRAELTRVTGVSPGRVSQALTRLVDAGLIERDGRAARAVDRRALLDAFLNDYRGPGGHELHTYSLDPPGDVALTIAAWTEKRPSERRVLFSADIGPDLLASWRRPTHLVVYSSTLPDLDALGMVEAVGRPDATIHWRLPADATVFLRPTRAKFRKREIELVDTPQMLWDLHDLGGDDRLEAAERLQTWFLNHRKSG